MPSESSGADQLLSAGPNVVTTIGVKFMPKDLTVKVGTTVTWQNGERIRHAVTSGAWGEVNESTGLRGKPGLGLAAALVLSGCTATPDAPAASDNMTSSVVTDTVNNDGATLRATLTGLLTDHVYLASAAIDQALADGGDLTTADVGAAVATLDKNSVEIAALIGSAYPDAEQPFLDSWRSHIPFFVNYAVAKATGDQAGVDQALSDLSGYGVSFGQLINSVVPELPAEAVQSALETHAASLVAAIDADVAGDPAYFELLKEAAGHMSMTALALSTGLICFRAVFEKVEEN